MIGVAWPGGGNDEIEFEFKGGAWPVNGVPVSGHAAFLLRKLERKVPHEGRMLASGHDRPEPPF